MWQQLPGYLLAGGTLYATDKKLTRLGPRVCVTGSEQTERNGCTTEELHTSQKHHVVLEHLSSQST
jgi:hypothetical protein